MTAVGLPGEAPSPLGTEMVFHDPFSHDLPEKHADMRFDSSRKPHRMERKRPESKQPPTRAAAIEAVSRELKILARSKGIPAG